MKDLPVRVGGSQSSDEPGKPKRPGFPLWILAVIIPVGGALALCCIGSIGFVAYRWVAGGPAAPHKDGPIANAPDAEGGDMIKSVGNVKVEILSAGPGNVSRMDFGAWKFDIMLLVKLKLTNTSSTRIITFGGWHRKATLADEHGNTYRAIDFGPGFRGFGDMQGGPEDAGSDTSAILARNLSLHPGKSYITYLFFETPAAVSKEARLSMPANELGGTGTLRMRARMTEQR